MILKSLKYHLFLLSFGLLFVSCEKGKDDSVFAEFIYNLSQLNETDSTVTLTFAFSTAKSLPTNSNKFHTLNMGEALVSIIPIVDSTSNFLTTLLAGSSLTEVQPIVSGSLPRLDTRGIYIRSNETTNNVALEYHFTIKKGVPYLFYHTYGIKTCYLTETSAVSERTIDIRENIVPKDLTIEYSQLEQLMETDFPATPDREMRGFCARSESSYSFYRDRPVKLLYYPL